MPLLTIQHYWCRLKTFLRYPMAATPAHGPADRRPIGHFSRAVQPDEFTNASEGWLQHPAVARAPIHIPRIASARHEPLPSRQVQAEFVHHERPPFALGEQGGGR